MSCEYDDDTYYTYDENGELVPCEDEDRSTVATLKREREVQLLRLQLIDARLATAEQAKRADDWASKYEQMRQAAKAEEARAIGASGTLQGLLIDLRKLLAVVVPKEMSSGDLLVFYDNVRELYAQYNG